MTIVMNKATKRTPMSPKKMRIAIKKLKIRVENGEIVVALTDKSEKYTVMSLETYTAMGEIHTLKDRQINEQELKTIQNT